MVNEIEGLDALDRRILQILQNDARISNVELAQQIHLSPPATHLRLKRLESSGFIKAHRAILDREALGYDLLVFVHVTMTLHQHERIEKFRETIRKMPEVLECHHVTGEYDYLLKVVARNRKDLERFVVGKLTPLPGVARILTSIVFNEVKSTTALPLE